MTVLPLSVVKGCNLRPASQTLKAANGSPIPVLGEATVSFVTQKYKATVTGLVTEHIVEVMLGINWLYETGAKWGFQEASIQLGDRQHDLIVRTLAKKWSRRVLEKDVEIDPGAFSGQRAVQGRLFSTAQYRRGVIEHASVTHQSCLYVARTVITFHERATASICGQG